MTQYVLYPLSWRRLEIATWWHWSAYRKWALRNRMVTWPMTSRDPERSRSWPQCVWCPSSRKWLEVATWWQYNAYRKWPPGNQMVTWPLDSGWVISYWWSFGPKSLSVTVSEIFRPKHHVLTAHRYNAKPSLRMRVSRDMYPPMQILSIYFNFSPPLCLFTMSLSLSSDEE